MRERGDAALRELTARFDATEIGAGEIELRVPVERVKAAREQAGEGFVGALEVAARNIRAVARAELEASADTRLELSGGQAVSVLARPMAAAGVYVPGGRAAYPSSVLMCCIPARVAGVERIALASPAGPDGRVDPVVLAACAIAGVDEVHALGGAAAIAALAYGTESVMAVDVIAGPGNRFVNAAKRLVFGDVGVDGVAGPSELVLVSDGSVDARALALDLLAQAEHGDDGLLVAIAPDPGPLDELADHLAELAPVRPSVKAASLLLVEAPEIGAAVELADAIAPEHLELAFAGADERVAGDRTAGCVFFGPVGAVAFGDYAAGSNHVLPTGGGARFGGPLGVNAFRRRTSVVNLPLGAAAALAPRVSALAEAEGFPVHGESANARAAG